MATIGLKYFVYAPIEEVETGTPTVTWRAGSVLNRAITVDLSVNLNDVNLYADNRIAESIKEFSNGAITLNGDDVSPENISRILGHEVRREGTKTIIIARGGDNGGYFGVGFFADRLKDNVKSYRALWIHKVKFGIPNENFQTKGDSITFQTKTIAGTFLTDVLDAWKTESIFETEREAIDWLNVMAKIT